MKTRKEIASNDLHAVLSGVEEFLGDVEAVGLEKTEEDWPDLAVTYRKLAEATGRRRAVAMHSDTYHVDGGCIVGSDDTILYDDLDDLSVPARHRLAELHTADPDLDWEHAADILNAEGLKEAKGEPDERDH